MCSTSWCSVSPRSALHRLSVEDLDRTSCPRVDLIVHHVFEALVVSGAEEDLRSQLTTCETVIQHLQDPREDRQHDVYQTVPPH